MRAKPYLIAAALVLALILTVWGGYLKARVANYNDSLGKIDEIAERIEKRGKSWYISPAEMRKQNEADFKKIRLMWESAQDERETLTHLWLFNLKYRWERSVEDPGDVTYMEGSNGYLLRFNCDCPSIKTEEDEQGSFTVVSLARLRYAVRRYF